VPAKQAQSPEFKLQYQKKKEKRAWLSTTSLTEYVKLLGFVNLIDNKYYLTIT
jgi:hypothetical protein